MRRRYVYDPAVKALVELTPERHDTPRLYVQGDLEPFVSSVDGSVIGSRRDLREHNRRHDVVQTREVEGTWTAASKDRALRKAGAHPDQRRERIRVLSDAYEHARDQRRARASY